MVSVGAINFFQHNIYIDYLGILHNVSDCTYFAPPLRLPQKRRKQKEKHIPSTFCFAHMLTEAWSNSRGHPLKENWLL